MADIVDSANDLAHDLNQDALTAVRNLVPEENPDIHEDGECDCGETIPFRRLQLGYMSCVGCASYEAKKGKQFSKSRVRNYEYDE